MKNYLRSYVGLCALSFALGAPALAFAQTAPAPAEESADQASVIEDVIVTATKRESRAQETPIAIDVVTGENLRRNGITDLQSLETIAPGVQFGAFQSSAIITIRGVAGRDTTEIGDPAVAVNMDGVFLQRPSGMNASMFDLSRVEVLRGPQGTLYGRNATGGVLNLISQPPILGQFGGYGAATFGDYETINGEGALNLPLNDSMALRASFISKRHDGYRNNAPSATGTPGVDIPGVGGPSARANYRGDDEDTQGARLQLLYQPDDRLRALLIGSYVHEGGVGPTQIGVPTSQAAPPTRWSEVRAFPLNTQGDYDLTRRNLSAQLSYDFGPTTMSFIYGNVYLDVSHLYDNDGVETKSYAFRRGEESTDNSYELRFASNDGGRFNWQVGAYYYEQELDVNTLNFVIADGAPIVLRNFLYDVSVDSKAVFGQVSYDFTDALEVSLGLRYSEDHKERGGGFFGGPNLAAPPTTQPVLVYTPASASVHESSDDALTYHVGVIYRLSERNMLYANIDKGYKSGGFTTINAYGPETVLSYEVGSKNRFLDNTLQLNLSAFQYDYEGQQVGQLTPVGTQVLNAGSSTIRGAEIQGTWRVTSADTVDFSVNWLDAQFDEFIVATSGVNVDLAGNRLVQAPEWAISGGYDHAFDVGGGAMLTPRIQFVHRSESFLTFYNRSNDRQEAYTLWDANLTYRPADADWSVQLYGKNLTNEVTISQANIGGFTGTNVYQVGAPRTYGVRVTANF